MRRPGLLRRFTLALAVVAGASAGCSEASDSAAAGPTGSGGASGACATSACVGAISPSVTWAIEIDPPSNTGAALTELPSVDIGAASLDLTADTQIAVTTTFTAGAGASVPASANAVLTVPSLIPGRPDLTFEAALALNTTDGTVGGSLVLPAGTLGRTATLQLIPLSPADRQSPPASFPVTVATSFTEALPSNLWSVGGTLLSAVGMAPSATFIARAFQAGTQVSNAPLTGSDGTFQLLLAPLATDASVVVELTPQNQSGPDPWYTSSPFTPMNSATPLPSIMLPAYSNPNVFTFTVQGADPGTTVGGAFVRARAILQSSAAGSTDFLRDGMTGSDGTVTLSLLPGIAKTTLDYDLTVIPPASSPYATRCVSPVPVTAGGTASAPLFVPSVTLSRRPVLAGTVRSASGLPIAHVAITATADSAPTDNCASTPAASSSTFADGNGLYQLPLDPGTYQLDFDPPAGSPSPRFTEMTIPIPAGAAQITNNVTLPVAASVQGIVHAADGATPLPSATVRIFEVRCTGAADCTGPERTPPALLAQIVTDANGSFLAVVPAAGAGN